MQDVHSLLDYVVVAAVVDGEPMGKRLRIPCKSVLPAEQAKYPDAELVIEIFTYWDGVKSERSEDANEPRRPDSSTKCH